MCEKFTNQPIRASDATEWFHGPGDYRVNVQQYTGNVRVLLQRFPVVQVTAAQVAPNAVFPRTWTALPANYFEPEYPPIISFGSSAPSAGGQGGQAVILAPGYLDWSYGRWGWALQVTYVSGWPHTSLTAPAVAGATTLAVESCAGWVPPGTGGAQGIIYDGASQEVVSVTAASATLGPGNLTIPAPGLTYAHAAGTMVSALPQTVIFAAALKAAAAALTRGATATVVNETPGRSTGTTRPDALIKQAEDLLRPYRRVV